MSEQLSATFAVSQVLSATFSRSVNVPSPNTTVLSVATVQENGSPATSLPTVTCVVTFPDGTTQSLSIGSGITNTGSGTYTATYETKGPGLVQENWTFTDANAPANTLNSHNITPVTY